MTNNKLDKFKKLVSKEKSGWLEKAKWRKENEAWLDISFDIAVSVMSALKTNKSNNITPGNQRELATAMGCSAQYVNKLLKGTENLQLETITKIERILNIKLIEVPKAKITEQVDFPILTSDFFSKSFYDLLNTGFNTNDIIISTSMNVGKVQLNYNTPLIEEQKEVYKCKSVEYLKVA